MPPLFLLYLWSNYNQTWHDCTLRQNLSKALKSLLTSSLQGNAGIDLTGYHPPPPPPGTPGFCTKMCAQPQGFCTTENARALSQ